MLKKSVSLILLLYLTLGCFRGYLALFDKLSLIHISYGCGVVGGIAAEPTVAVGGRGAGLARCV